MPTSATFRDLPFMGVIHVNNQAMLAGWKMGDPEWSNLGQGQPEVGHLDGAPHRIAHFDLNPADAAYGPVEGITEYRQSIADHYNRLYRKGKSQYTVENVCVAPGGRAALTRLAASLDRIRMAYFTPDYTAYEDMFNTFTRIEPVHIALTPDKGFRISPEELAGRVQRDRLGAILISNPCNPTGVVLRGAELAAWVNLSRTSRATLILDEFYSHYNFTQDHPGPVSAAAHIEDINSDPVIIVDGLTKNFRYPGWRSGWILAPKSTIRTLTAAGSFLDGGASRPIQRAGIEVLKPARADQETNAVRTQFKIKRDLTVNMLRGIGVQFPIEPEGTFYAWGDVSKLPSAFNTGEKFMRKGFDNRALTIPGEFFDVNPGKARTGPSPLANFVRFSYGPPRDNLEAGLSRLVAMVKSAR